MLRLFAIARKYIKYIGYIGIYTQGRYKNLFFKTGKTPVLEYADETSALPENAEFITSYRIQFFSGSVRVFTGRGRTTIVKLPVMTIEIPRTVNGDCRWMIV